jgi:hypothetical protein
MTTDVTVIKVVMDSIVIDGVLDPDPYTICLADPAGPSFLAHELEKNLNLLQAYHDAYD